MLSKGRETTKAKGDTTMINELKFNTNNGNVLSLTQVEGSEKVFVTSLDSKWNVNYEYSISPDEFTMLLNMYRCIKDNDIKNDFINPNGKNREVL